jgi:hypothetical protein
MCIQNREISFLMNGRNIHSIHRLIKSNQTKAPARVVLDFLFMH